MIDAYIDCSFPDYTTPLFSDNRFREKEELMPYYRAWAEVFPANAAIPVVGDRRPRGTARSTFRGRCAPRDSTSAQRLGRRRHGDGPQGGPQGFWHCQPDNGTFELWHRGRNFFPDSGSYVYAGDKEVTDQRNWFRQTQVHNTLTLDGRNLEHTDSKCLRWETDDATHIVTVGNPSYEGLTHRRTVWFVDRQFFVIADEASGTAEGEVGLHYNLVECDPAEDFAACSAATRFSDGNNLLLKVFGAERMERREGWVSRTYRQRTERPAYAFTVRKRAGKPVRLVTVLLPAEDAAGQRVEAVWRGNRLQVKINGTKYNLK